MPHNKWYHVSAPSTHPLPGLKRKYKKISEKRPRRFFGSAPLPQLKMSEKYGKAEKSFLLPEPAPGLLCWPRRLLETKHSFNWDRPLSPLMALYYKARTFSTVWFILTPFLSHQQLYIYKVFSTCVDKIDLDLNFCGPKVENVSFDIVDDRLQQTNWSSSHQTHMQSFYVQCTLQSIFFLHSLGKSSKKTIFLRSGWP